MSPALTWDTPPDGAGCFVLVCEDPDAQKGPWIHWIMYNIPAAARGLKQGVQHLKIFPDGSSQGRNDFGRIGYGGPCPPKGAVHRYFFRLYAVKERLAISPDTARRVLAGAMEGRVLGMAETFCTSGG
jgi:Raf kinase inhibitor-like YbhB/YbcL family protein